MKIAEVCCDGLLLSLSANFLTLTRAGYKLNIFGDAVLRPGQHPIPVTPLGHCCLITCNLLLCKDDVRPVVNVEFYTVFVLLTFIFLT